MSANQACFPICVMARVLGVSKAGYYAWRHRPPSAHARADEALLARIKTVHISSRQTYGAPRVHAELRAAGERHGRKRIARLMRVAGLVGASRRRGGPITTQRDKQARPAPDLVDRDFQAAGPNQLWVADITYLPTAAGFLYLAVVVDVWSRRVVGWAMTNHLRSRAGSGRPQHGPRPASAARRDPSFRPGQPIYLARFRQALQRSRRAALDGLGRGRLRQRPVRELLCHPRMRTARAAPLRLAGRGTHGLLQLYRGLLQSHPAPFSPGVSLAHRPTRKRSSKPPRQTRNQPSPSTVHRSGTNPYWHRARERMEAETLSSYPPVQSNKHRS